MFYHIKLVVAWIAHLLFGVFLAGVFDPVRIALLLIGVFCVAQFQHNLHVFSGASSTYSAPDRTIPKIGMIVFGICGSIIALLLTIGRWFFPVFVAVGLVFVVLYATLHQELFWSFGHFTLALGGYYAMTGSISLPITLIVLAVSLLAYVGIMCYRLITGDYDTMFVEARIKILLPKVVIVYCISIPLVGVGVWLLQT